MKVDMQRWWGEGGKATLVGHLTWIFWQQAIDILRKRIATGTATFLVNVTAHRREPATEGTNTLMDKAHSDLKVGKKWCQ